MKKLLSDNVCIYRHEGAQGVIISVIKKRFFKDIKGLGERLRRLPPVREVWLFFAATPHSKRPFFISNPYYSHKTKENKVLSRSVR
jgi:hypothetical protein